MIDATVLSTIRTVESLGQGHYQRYHRAAIIDHTQPIHDPIKKNSLLLFRSPRKQLKSKQTGEMSLLDEVDTAVIVILVGKFYFFKTLCAVIDILVAFGVENIVLPH